MRNSIRKERAVVLTFISLLFMSLVFTALPITRAQPTTVRFIPSVTEIHTAGETFTVACVVEDVIDLAGLDIKISWNTTYLAYVDHTATLPVEDYPSPIPPSPYAGIIHAPLLTVKDEVGSDYYWAVFSTLGGPGFDGSGTVFVITFAAIYVPWDFEIAPATYIDTLLHFEVCDLADSAATPIPHTVEDGVVRIYAKPFAYPPWPLLKVTPETISGIEPSTNFPVDVMLMGDGHVDLDPFWDVSGFDIIMTFNNTHIEAVDVTIDPDGWFAGFWPEGIIVLKQEIDNLTGTVHVAFVGIPGPGGSHTPPYGQGRLFTVTFHALIDSEDYPPPESKISLTRPTVYVGTMNIDADAGLIDIANPISTTWHELSPHFSDGPYHLYGWQDNGDGVLSPSDQILLNNTSTGYYFDYHIDDITVTLKLLQQPFSMVDDYVWATDAITEYGLTDYCGLPGRTIVPINPVAFDGDGNPCWTGNFTPAYPFVSVNSITAHFVGNGTSRTLVEGVDYKVYPDEDLIELLNPVDVPITNEHWVDGVNNSLNGWPWIGYTATGIQSVYVRFPNGTERYSPGGFGYFESPPPGEWWYEPDYPCELEGWWVLGYMGHEDPAWPSGSEWWINYTAASYLTIDFNAEPDPEPRYLEFQGTYADALAALSDPVCSDWQEVYPSRIRSYHVYGFDDTDASGDVTVCDYLLMEEAAGNRTYHVEEVSTDLTVSKKPWICDYNPSDPFYGVKPIVDVAGFPHPDRELCPWHNKAYSVRIPHKVEDATYIVKYTPAIGIDVYTQYPYPYGGQDPYQPSDMFWPQKEVILYAFVMYNHWPEQYKDVSFFVYDPQGDQWGVFYNKTDSTGIATVRFTLPWPCAEWPDVIGVWTVTAKVDIASTCYNDTLWFHYDYLVNIIKVTTDKPEYKHCEDINVTVTFTSHSQISRLITITVTVLDDSGVPFGYAAVDVWIENAVFCTPKEYTVTFTLHVVKWARPKIGTIHAGSLDWRGCPAGPLFEPIPTFSILAA